MQILDNGGIIGRRFSNVLIKLLSTRRCVYIVFILEYDCKGIILNRIYSWQTSEIRIGLYSYMMR